VTAVDDSVAAEQRDRAAILIDRATAMLDATRADGRVRGFWSRAVDAAIVLGSAQRIQPSVPAGWSLLRRGTGGGAVVCDPDYLMLDVTVPPSDPRALRDLAASYRWLSDALLEALRAAGASGLRPVLPEEVRGASPADRAAGRIACFAGLGPYEIVDAAGRKLVGLAQRRRGGAALFQAALYLRGTQTRLADLLPLEPGQRDDVRARLTRVTTLEAVAPSFHRRLPTLWQT
jgi:lipoate-protein ligase A